MIQPFLRKLKGAFFFAPLALALALTVAGCGRRGPLEPPPAETPESQTSPTSTAPTQPTQSAASNEAATGAAETAAPTTATQPAQPALPNVFPPLSKSFFLDPLVK